MTPLLAQFLSEARDFLQGIGEKLMQLEKAPDDAQLMTELFRLVHTLKGNSGLFDFPEMTRVLHAGEDLMDAVRNRRVAYSKELADRLLDAMDFVGLLCDEIENSERIGARHAEDAVRLAQALRALIVDPGVTDAQASSQEPSSAVDEVKAYQLPLAQIPEAARMAAYRRVRQGDTLHWLTYSPAEECFYQGDDPFFQARQTPDLFWGGMAAREPWPKLAELYAYRCVLDFHLLTGAPREEIDELYRYMPDQLRKEIVPPLELIIPQGEPNGGPVYEDFVVEAHRLLRADDCDGLRRAAQTMLELSSPELWLSSALRWLLVVLEVEPENASVLSIVAALVDSLRNLQTPDWSATAVADVAAAVATPNAASPQAAGVRALTPQESAALATLVATQKEILALPIKENWQLGRLRAVAATLAACLRMRSMHDALPELESATAQALDETSAAPLHDWLLRRFADVVSVEREPVIAPPSPAIVALTPATATPEPAAAVAGEGEQRFGRRAEDAIAGPKSLKVDQAKIDRLMNLIGEMVVSKNALPYLAARAEAVFGVRELSREIKAQYAVINRIAEEMQDAIMQVRMMPVSFVFQRFPRLVRDTSRKLDKEVNLVLLGEDTEAD
ncbi:MAG TPA: Hpt domain-containing protein, partial [Rhodocyclaceae bacterium]|nr:Hpt domain-containing protein [Rhodocyclaceae bacterium]